MSRYRSDWLSGFRALIDRGKRSRFRRLVLLTRAALLFERLARALAPATIVAGFFVALSWTGLWLGAAPWFRAAGSLTFLVLFLIALRRLGGFSPPSGEEARAALDADHVEAPATALADALSNKGDPQTERLWRLHLRRAENLAARLRMVWPAPRLWADDPYAMGALAALALCAGAFLAGPEKYARLAAAFDWRFANVDAAASRIDAWIDPPAYTGKPPFVLSAAKADENALVSAPVGSIITVRATDEAGLILAPKGGVQAMAASAQGAATPKERRFVLRGDGDLRLSRGASEITDFSFHGITDTPPTITPLGRPENNSRGSFILTYRIDDDYGARNAEVSARVVSTGSAPEGHPLFAPPTGQLELPTTPGGVGEAHSTIDWTDSPYAGARVDLQLTVHDEGGNEGQAVLRDVVLPKKPLTNPLALALAEQRRLLALDSAQRDRVLASIDTLMIAPELFTPDLGVYLGLRYAHTALRRARGDSDLVAVSDFLWEMALRIEDGDAPRAERDLRAAEKALREALARGAPPEEIARLTQQLQKAMDEFLAEMEKNAARKSQSGESETGDGKSVTPQDLKSMLDQMAEAAKNGDKQAAMEMLDRMQEMLENLRSAQKSDENGKAAQNRKAMRDIDRLMREQQKLRDDTFARQHGEPDAQAGANDKQQEGAKRNSDAAGKQDEPQDQDALDQRQGQLREKLETLRRKAENADEAAPKGLAEAEEAMRDAEESLGKGDDAKALDAQRRALDGLSKGAGEMAKQAQQGGEAPGDEEGPNGKGRGMRGQNGEGPFGRPTRMNNVDATTAQKARKVLEELRRRLSDPNRARDELDYLERLIKPD